MTGTAAAQRLSILLVGRGWGRLTLRAALVFVLVWVLLQWTVVLDSLLAVWPAAAHTFASGGMVAIPEIAGGYVLRPVPLLNVTLFVYGVQLLPQYSQPEKVHFHAIVEDNLGRLPRDYVQLSPHENYRQMKLSLVFEDAAPLDDSNSKPRASAHWHRLGLTTPCEIMASGNLNAITCALPKEATMAQSSNYLFPDTTSVDKNLFSLLQRMSLVDEAHEVHLPLPVAFRRRRMRNFTLCLAFVKQPPAAVVAEFVHYHALLGVDRFVIYDRTGDTIAFLSNLAAVMAAFDVEVEGIYWPGMTVNRDYVRRNHGYYDQEVALDHCLVNSIGRSRWQGSWDLDEFFHSASVRNIPAELDRIVSASSDSLRHSGFTIPRVNCLFERRTYDAQQLVSLQVKSVYTKDALFKFIVKPDHALYVTVHYYGSRPGYAGPAKLETVSDMRLLHHVNLYSERIPPDSPVVKAADVEELPSMEKEWFVQPLLERLAATVYDGENMLPLRYKTKSSPSR